MVKHLGTLTEETFHELRGGLVDRLQDKDLWIRAKAAGTLALLCAPHDDLDGVDQEDKNAKQPFLRVHQVLYECMAYDDSFEVRKAIVCNIRIDSDSIRHVLDRLRDEKPVVRKALYDHVLKAKIYKDKDAGDFSPGSCHPTKLDTTHRLEIMHYGLRDREKEVKTAAESLLVNWLAAYERTFQQVKAEPESSAAALLRKDDGLIAFLSEFSVHTLDKDDLETLESMVRCIFIARQDIRNAMDFGDRKEWETGALPEKAFITRVFVRYCAGSKNNQLRQRMDEILPTVGEMASIIEKKRESLMNHTSGAGDGRRSARADYILAELLRMATHLDYSDHQGRQDMLTIIRAMLADLELPRFLLPLCVDVLRGLSSGDRDLINIGVELIQSLREGDEEEDEQDPEATDENTRRPLPLFLRPRSEMDPELRKSLNLVDLRCLRIARGMFERINTTFEKAPSLNGLYRELITPTMQAAEAARCTTTGDEQDLYEQLFEESVYCLSLCALVCEVIKFPVFGTISKSINKKEPTGDIKLLLLKSMFDLVLLYGKDLLCGFPNMDFQEVIVDNCVRQIKEQTNDPAALTVVCLGMAKLISVGVVCDKDSIAELYNAYVDPATAGIEAIRQPLSFFFQYYSAFHPKMMTQIFKDVFRAASHKRQSPEYEDELVIEPARLCDMFVDHVTPPKEDSNTADQKSAQNSTRQIDETVHLDFAKELLVTLFEQEDEAEKKRKEKLKFTKDEKKALFQCLSSKVRFPDKPEDIKILEIGLLLEKMRRCHPPRDYYSNQALTKFETNFTTKYKAEIEALESDDYRQLDDLNELFSFLDSIMPDDEESGDEREGPTTRGKKRRSMSTANSEMEDIKPTIEECEKAHDTKRRRVSEGPSASPPPRRQKKKKQRARSPEVIVISSDSDEEVPPARNAASGSSSRRQPARQIKEEDDDEIQDLTEQLSQNVSLAERTWDSIMDSDPPDQDNDEDEEDEVSRLVADSD
ncbi:nuclear condensing complex subunit [Coprinopsis sp. MPI-PUGE-AT-0042]|nr:nuclear condensing complex subunit [Coprinopsis sp. MPI-PUGE-AT-0042]